MKRIILYSLLTFTLGAFAQEIDNIFPKANDEFNAKKYTDAEANYRISASKSPKKASASYNLGNAIYKINQPAEAGLSYLKAIEKSKTFSEKHKAYFNLGNVCMKLKDYTRAVQAYKSALKNDPTDEETRYNFALAKKMLKDNPPKKEDKKDKKNDKKDDKKDKNKDKKDDKKEGDKDKKDDKKDGDKKDKKDNKSENGKPKPEGAGISKQRLENLLEAVNNEEKKIQDRVNANKAKGKPVQTDKDW